MIEMVGLGLLGVVLACQGWTMYRMKAAQVKFSNDLEAILDNAEGVEDNLNALAPILQAVLERIDGGMELMQAPPESPFAPILASLLQRWIDNTTKPTPGTWPDAEQKPELVAESPESTS